LASSKRRVLIILPFWLASNVWLWSWWFTPAHIVTTWLYAPLTAALLYEYALMPSFFLYSILRARNPINRRPIKYRKVALITPCVPAQESLEIIEKQLKAMAAVSYPHDSWILDEGNSKEVRRLARKHGVRYFTRKGKPRYNQQSYPFMAKTKAGNINAWLHFTKRYKYEYFVQLDVDHLPQPNYLHKTLGHFRDEQVGWVQAPSVYSNLQFWTARGSAEQELGFQGALQMGLYGSIEAPVIVGSHTTFRMSAINAIGGFQATRAEDHLNTLALMANGWKGVFVPEVIAEGDGPETFATYLSQQYAWARSMTQILWKYRRSHSKAMPWKHRLHYLFLQTWYPASSLAFLIMFVTPFLALVTDHTPVSMNGWDYLSRFPLLLLGAGAGYWAARPLAQPAGVHLSWRGIVLHLIRWPIILRAIIGVLLRRKKPYQITPKGKQRKTLPTVGLYRPFLALSSLSAVAIIYATLAYGHRVAAGQIIFAMVNLCTMLIICLLDLNIRLSRGLLKVRECLQPFAAIMAVTILAALAIVLPLSPDQTSLALSTDIKRPSSPTNPLSTPPQLLSDQAVRQEIANPKYRFTSQDPPSTGIYIPGRAIKTSSPYIRHTFIDWQERRTLDDQLLLSERVGATSLITIEPKGESDGGKLLQDISAGVYDDRLIGLIDDMSLSPNLVYVRFAHEMDIPDIYPWGDQDPQAFVDAYQHVIDLARRHHATNLRWVWSPAGTSQATLYYPGDDYVDIIGTTMLYDSYWSGDYVPTFSELQADRTGLLQFGKPVWITELGIGNKDPEIQTQLLTQALDEYQADGYAALIYLDIPDSNLQGPDYRLSSPSDLGGPFATPVPSSTPAVHHHTTAHRTHKPAAKPKPQPPKGIQFHCLKCGRLD